EKEIEVAAKGHSYDLEKDPEFTWAEDNKSATASFACTECDHKEVVDCDVTYKSEGATCTEAGTVTYTATCEFNGKTFTGTKTVDGKPLGHDYSKHTFEWGTDEDGAYVVYADFACSRCDDVQHEKCAVTHETTKEATYVESGVETYTATCEFEGKTYTDTKEVEIPKLDAEAKMSKSSVTVYATAKTTLTLSSKYEDDKIVSNKTADTAYASTSRSGNKLTITGKKAGKTSVTVKTASNETIKINVTVKTPSVKLTATKAPLQVKKSTTAIKVSSKISTDAISSVSSSSTSRVKAYRVKTSSGNYSTTGIKLVAQSKTGTATITVKMKSGAKATCKVTVQKSAVKVTSVSVPSTSVTLRLAGANKKTTYKIAAKRYPVTATSKITYSSSNKKVATVTSSGTITAKKAGKATITVKSGTKTKKITVTVKSK
ncbi:MAG: Ig-like domain-containing protein, partial [Anaerostipes sp.]|nr:Ig-like domain-containing protein [Anaerostipes sp.]